MKKQYILILSLFISASITAQSISQNISSMDYAKSSNNSVFMDAEVIVESSSISLTPSLNVIWESDFSDPSQWNLDNSGQNPPIYGWSIDPTSDGWFAANGINSTSGGNYAELSNGDPTIGTQALNVTYTMTTAQPINVFDSIGSGNATLTFEEFGARFNDLQEVQVSIDGTNFITVGDNLAYSVLTASGGSAYANPIFREINIAPYIGTSPTTVWLRFSWTTNYPNSATNPNVWVAYGWYIDDVKVVQSPANKIVMTDEVIGGWWIDYLNVGGLGQDYTFYPISQATANPYVFEAVISNEGTEPQEVTMNIDVKNAGGVNIFSTTSNSVMLASNEKDTLGGNDSFNPPSTGLYTVDMSSVADSAGYGTVMNYSDIYTKSTLVTDYIYGKDFNTPEGDWNLNRAMPSAGGFEISSTYDIYADVYLYSVDAHISSWSVIGTEIYAVLYEEDPAGGDPIPLAQSDNYAITSSDRGSWVSIPFLTPQALMSATKTYRIAVGANIHPTDTAGIDMSSGDGPTKYSSDGLFDKDGILSGSTGATWWNINEIPMLRMNFEPVSVNVININPNIFNVYPNPTNGVFTISISHHDIYDLEISNILGQTVYSSTISQLENIIDLSKFDKGIYTVELKNGQSSFNETVVID